MPSISPSPSPLRMRTRASGPAPTTDLPPHIKAQNHSTYKSPAVRNGEMRDSHGMNGEWVVAQPNAAEFRPESGRKRFTFVSTQEGDHLSREKIVAPSNNGADQHSSAYANYLAKAAYRRIATLPAMPANINSSNSNSSNKNNNRNNARTSRADISFPSGSQSESTPESSEDVRSFEDPDELIRVLRVILYDKNLEAEIKIKPAQGQNTTHTIHIFGDDTPEPVQPLAESQSDTSSVTSEQCGDSNPFDYGQYSTGESGNDLMSQPAMGLDKAASPMGEGSQTDSSQQSDAESDKLDQLPDHSQPEVNLIPDFLLKELDRNAVGLDEEDEKKLEEQKKDEEEEEEEEEVFEEYEMEIVSLADFLPQAYQGRPTVRPPVQLSKEPPTQRPTQPPTQKVIQPPTQPDEDSDDDEREFDIFGGRRPGSLPQDAGPVYETENSGSGADNEPPTQKVIQPLTQQDEDSDDEREFDIFGGRRPGSLPQDAGPEYETENSGSGADNVGRDRDPAAEPKHDLHAEAAGSGATKSTDTPAGFLPSWPQQQPREKRATPIVPAKNINRPTYDNLPKSYNRGGGRNRRAGAVPVIPPVCAPSPTPVFVDPTPLDGASVAVYLEGLPRGTSTKLLFPEIRGGAIHSVAMFSTKHPNERTITSRQAVVYFMSPQSADRFVASHERNPVKVLGYRINIGRTVPATKLTQQLRRFPAGYTRCLRITNLPEYKYSVVYISKWIDDVLDDIEYESLAFDHQSSTAVFQFLSVEHANTFKTNFIETKAKDMDWRNVRIDFCQDPTATLI